MRGLIIKSIGGLYSVKTPDSVIECKAKGIFRHKEISPCVGDNVEVDIAEALITDIYERKNCLIRPPLANLDLLVFVVSTTEPVPNFKILDKLCAIAEYEHIEPLIAVTKSDIAAFPQIKEIYGLAGIKVIVIDYTDGSGLEEIHCELNGKISAFTGNSGVGKSTLLNHICPELSQQTGEISRKLGRGRHTTRHVELFELAKGGFIADTPGFSSMDTNRYDIIFPDELKNCFREFAEYEGKCRFQDCAHIKEKGCAVIEAVERGEISASRHESYVEMYESAKQLKKWDLPGHQKKSK